MNMISADYDSKYVPGDFDRFHQFFTDKELARLRSLDLDSKSDSTFIKTALEYLHKENLSSLANKTAMGKVINVLDGANTKTVVVRECI